MDKQFSTQGPASTFAYTGVPAYFACESALPAAAKESCFTCCRRSIDLSASLFPHTIAIHIHKQLTHSPTHPAPPTQPRTPLALKQHHIDHHYASSTPSAESFIAATAAAPASWTPSHRAARKAQPPWATATPPATTTAATFEQGWAHGPSAPRTLLSTWNGWPQLLPVNLDPPHSLDSVFPPSPLPPPAGSLPRPGPYGDLRLFSSCIVIIVT